MEMLDTISGVVHIGTASVLVGGSVFTLMVLMPAAKRLPDEPHRQLAEAITGRWRRLYTLALCYLSVAEATTISGHWRITKAMGCITLCWVRK